MTIQPVGKAGMATPLLTTAENNAVQERMNAAALQRSQNAQVENRAEQARLQADRTTFSSRFWNPDETIDFSMDTYTRNGTRVQVEAGSRSLTLGHLANNGALENTFTLAGARADLDMSVTFTTADGKASTYKINKSMEFHETEDGQIVEGRGMDKVHDKDDPTQTRQASNIVINMDDKGAALGGEGDDVLLNFASEATISGQEGNDTIVNMGNKATIKGGEGNDLIKVIKDVIRPESKSTLDLSAMRDEDPVPMWGVKNNLIDLDAATMVDSMAGQEVTVDAGNGDDIVDARGVKLERATIKGNAGNDTMLFDELVASNVRGGEGDDFIQAEDVLQSTVDGGKGDDVMDVTRVKASTVSGNAGNDTLRVDQAHDTDILGGDGDDSIDMGTAYESVIDGGDGNDVVSARVLDRSILNGGKGDDVIAVDQALSSVIDAGAGDDLVSVNVFDNGTNSARTGANRVPVIMGGSGKDTILVGSAIHGVIAGNKDDDTIVVGRSDGVIISGGKGNDAIRTGTSKNTILDGGMGTNALDMNRLENPEDAGHGSNVVVDNGRLVQGTATQLAGLAGNMAVATGDVSDEVAELYPYTRQWRDEERSGTLLNRDQKNALKGYLDSLQQLAQSEGAGRLVK